MTSDARVYPTTKLNYQSYANSSTLDTNRRAAVIMTWANKTIYLYHFVARQETFLFTSHSWNIYLFLVIPRLTVFSANPRIGKKTRESRGGKAINHTIYHLLCAGFPTVIRTVMKGSASIKFSCF